MTCPTRPSDSFSCFNNFVEPDSSTSPSLGLSHGQVCWIIPDGFAAANLPFRPFTVALQGTRLEPAQLQVAASYVNKRAFAMTSKSGPLPAYLGRYLELNKDRPARPDTTPNNIVLHIIVLGVTASNHASDSHVSHLQYSPTIRVVSTFAAHISSPQVLRSRPALRPRAARKLSAATATSSENPGTDHGTPALVAIVPSASC